jgi:serine phosphatase RsbU (regulator of sigma subunit)/predicted ATPase
VLAALESLDAMRVYAARVERDYGFRFAMRFCLNTGPVVIGPVGNDLKYEYTAMGGAVNLAARLKFAASPMTVMVSEHTLRFVGPVFESVDLGWIEVKDRLEPVHIYQVLRSRAEPGRLRGLAGLESPLVGRDAQLSDLLQLSEAVRAGIGRAVLVTGEPGLGKSRLIAEWQAAIAATGSAPAPQWAVGHCLSYGQGMAYHLVIELLRSLLGVTEKADLGQVRDALVTLMRDLLGDIHSTAAQEVYPYLGHLLGIDLDGEDHERIWILDPQALQAQYLGALRKILLKLAGSRPLIIVLEDLHWADPSSIELFSQLLPLVFSAPVLFCLVIRPERESPGWKLVSQARQLLGRSLSELVLEPLSDRESRQMVANLLEIDALPESVRSLILQKAEGNPFFVEEVVRMLIEQGVILRQGSGWVVAGAIESLDIPDNLQGLLLARIDRLSEKGKHTLRVASVLGRQFPVRVLEHVLGAEGESSAGETEGTLSTLSSLESAGMIRMAQVHPDLEYLFRHTLVQDAAYSSLLSSDRKRLHQKVGETIERMYPDRLATREMAPRLGLHFSAAGDNRRALKYFTLAGEAALASYANVEAEVHFRRGLELSRTNADCARLLTGLAEALARQSRYHEAIQTWQEGIAWLKKTADDRGMARLYALAARAAWWAGDVSEGLRLSQQGLAELSAAPESVELALLVHEAARAHYFNGYPDQAKRLCEQALEMAQRLGSIEVQADTLATMGILRDQPAESILAALTRAVELAESAGLLTIAKRAHINLGSAKRGYLGDLQAAREHYQRAVEIARLRGVAQEELFTLISLLGLVMEQGDFAETARMLEQMDELLTLIPDPQWAAAEVNSLRAFLRGLHGDWPETARSMRACLPVARQRGDLQNLQYYASFLGQALLEIESAGEPVDWSEAEAALSEAIAISDRGIGDSAGATFLLSMVRARQARFQEARELLEKAREKTRAVPVIGNELSLAWAEALLAISEKRWTAGLSAYETGVGICARLGLRWMWARLLLGWAEALVGRGNPGDQDRAWGLYLESSARFQAIGAAGYVERIEKRLKSLREQALAQAAAHREITREMAQARRLQASFLPQETPRIPGWDLAAKLEPARETSGDYYDFIPLPGPRLGIVVADVADKGAGAALFMASSRTLIRTFAEEYPTKPDQVIAVVNRRMLADTHAGLFVTMFYAVLEPASGDLTYCNAGHNPPYHFSRQVTEIPKALARTGVPVGVLEETSWGRGSVQLELGDALLLYTDGLTEAQNGAGEYFGAGRLQATVQDVLAKETGASRSATRILERLLAEVHGFSGDAHQADDITLLVLLRK